MGLYATLLGNRNQQPYGTTYPGAGTPPDTQIAPGAPQIAIQPPAPQGAIRPPMMGGAPSMPAGASTTPQNGSGMFSGLANNPMLMMALAKQMGGANPASVASGAAGVGAGGQFGGMSGADANTLRSQLQGGAPGTEMISPDMAQFVQNGGAGIAPGGVNPSWLSQLMARFQGTPQ